MMMMIVMMMMIMMMMIMMIMMIVMIMMTIGLRHGCGVSKNWAGKILSMVARSLRELIEIQ